MPDTTRDEIARLEEEYAKNPEGRLFVHLAEAYRRAGELERARDVLTEGLERHADYLSARIVLAQVETELGETESARRVWREVVDLDPENELALWALAELEYNSGNSAESLEFYQRLAALGVDDAELDEMIALLESQGGAAPEGPASAAHRGREAAAERAAAVGAAADADEAAAWQPGPVESASGAGGHGTGGGKAGGQDRASQVRTSTGNGNGSTALAHTDAIGLSDLLVRLLEYRDATFHAGSSLTRLLALAIGRELELDRTHLEALALAALLSDLGGIGLESSDGRPLMEMEDSEERRRAEQREVAVSLQLLQGITLPAGVHEAVRHQHERWDGKGYPDGLREEQIPYGARVIAIARACADLLSRPGGGNGIQDAIDELQRNAGSRYDPVVVSVLRRVFQRRAEHGIGYGLGGRVMVVHPEELRALGVATQLHAEGYVAELSRETGGARDRVRNAPKAVVLGAGLPTTDVARFIRDVRTDNETAGTPVMVIDANDADLRVELLTAGADACFASDVSFREFKATLDALLRRREEIDRPRVEARL